MTPLFKLLNGGDEVLLGPDLDGLASADVPKANTTKQPDNNLEMLAVAHSIAM